jgi:hypothetical protein
METNSYQEKNETQSRMTMSNYIGYYAKISQGQEKANTNNARKTKNTK